MQTKIEELKRSRELRKEGKSLGEIAKILNVSKGSVSAWVRDVEIPENKKLELLEKAKHLSSNGMLIANSVNKEKYKILRQQYQEEGRILAKLKDPDFYSGCMLYWAEGNKERTVVQFTNSDHNMIRYFISFLIKYFNVKYENISIRCLYYSYKNLSNIDVENYWISKLNCPKTCIRKTSVDNKVRTSSLERQEKTKYGVVKITVCDVRIVQMIYGALQEIANFQNLEWLE